MNFFKDQLYSDIESVFLNPEEFGEMHQLDGREIICIADQGLGGLKGSSGDDLVNASMLGLDEETMTLYLADGIIPRPIPGQELEFDGEIWRVLPDSQSVAVSAGLLTLKMARSFS